MLSSSAKRRRRCDGLRGFALLHVDGSVFAAAGGEPPASHRVLAAGTRCWDFQEADVSDAGPALREVFHDDAPSVEGRLTDEVGENGYSAACAFMLSCSGQVKIRDVAPEGPVRCCVSSHKQARWQPLDFARGNPSCRLRTPPPHTSQLHDLARAANQRQRSPEETPVSDPVAG